ncbi:type 1 fimbrial protein (plasmid) [Escherichia coli]|nr:type 1 fimbrial protein [Escherichia coli]
MIMVVLRTTDFKIRMKKLSVFAGALLLGCSTWSFAASDVTLTVSGEINEGSCTLNLTNGNVNLGDIDVTNTSLGSDTATKPQEITLNITDCSPGMATHKPTLKFDGNVVDSALWRDTKSSSADNNAGEAYGVLINEKTNLLTTCSNKKGNSILNGYCELGTQGELIGDKEIRLSVGFGKSGSTDINTGGIKSSIKISFVYQ